MLGQMKFAGAHGLQQTGHSFSAAAALLQGIDGTVGQAADQAAHSHRPPQGLEEELAAAEQQVMAVRLDQPQIVHADLRIRAACYWVVAPEKDQRSLLRLPVVGLQTLDQGLSSRL